MQKYYLLLLLPFIFKLFSDDVQTPEQEQPKSERWDRSETDMFLHAIPVVYY